MAFRLRRHLSKMIISWLLLTAGILLVLGVLLSTGQKYLGVTIGVYCNYFIKLGTVETVLSCCYLKNKAIIPAKFIAYVEVMLMGLKKDEILVLEWSYLFYGVAILFIFCCILAVLLAILIIAA